MIDITNWIMSIGYTDDPSTDNIRLLVYGEPGVGKTRLAGSFPKPFFIDTDRGLVTVRSQHLPRLELSRGEKVYDVILRVLDNLSRKTPPFDKLEVETLVFDSLTPTADDMMYSLLAFPQPGKQKRDPVYTKPEWDDYIVLANQFKEIIGKANDLGLNVVATAGVKLEKDEVKGTYVARPNILGGYRDVIGHAFDDFYYMLTEGSGETVKYVTYTKKYLYYDAKSRVGMPAKISNADYQKIKDAFDKAKKTKEVAREPEASTEKPAKETNN